MLNDSGNIGLPDGYDDAAAEKTVVYTLVSTASGQVYLKLKSFGDYNGQKWSEADEYGELLLDGASAYYLASLACGATRRTAPSSDEQEAKENGPADRHGRRSVPAGPGP